MATKTTLLKRLSAEQMSKLQSLEEELGGCIVALEPSERASFSDDQRRRMQALENEINATLLAYKC